MRGSEAQLIGGAKVLVNACAGKGRWDVRHEKLEIFARLRSKVELFCFSRLSFMATKKSRSDVYFDVLCMSLRDSMRQATSRAKDYWHLLPGRHSHEALSRGQQRG
jgi:hypothetical protein